MPSFSTIEDVLSFLNLKKRNKSVLITGFGPFKDIKDNPSWIAVKAVDSKLIQKNHKITLFKEPIPVRYVDVDLIVPRLLERKRPHLTIHVGVSNAVSCFVLEIQARKSGYELLDNALRKAALKKNPSPGLDSIVTRLDVAAIQKEFNSAVRHDDLRAEISHDAGRYLCEYIYYTSLSLDRCPTLFVHVPLVPTDNYCKIKQLARGLERIIELCINQLDKATDMKPVLE